MYISRHSIKRNACEIAVFDKLPLCHSQLKQCILWEADWLFESKVAAGCLPPSSACDWVFCEKVEDEENIKEGLSLRKGVELEITSISSLFYI